MLYKFSTEQRKILQGLPETGMGSQHVDIYFMDGSVLYNISVFNCEEFESEKDLDIDLIERIEITQEGPNKR